MCVCVNGSVSMEAKKAIGPPGAESTGDCEPLNVGAGNQTQVL